MRLTLAAVMLVLVAHPSSAQSAKAQTDWLPPPAQTIQEFLASGASDLVVTGTILSAKEASHEYRTQSACGFNHIRPFQATEITLRVDNVIFGVAEDSTLHVSVLEQNYGNVVGKRALVWAYREGCDGWSLIGRMGVYQEDNTVAGSEGTPLFRTPDGSMVKVTASQVSSVRSLGFQHPSSTFNWSRAVALARVVSIERSDQHRAAYHVQFLNWISGHGTVEPTTVAFRRQSGCYPDIARGDSILIPVHGINLATVTLASCPTALRVKRGFAPGLGVPLDDLDRVLHRVGPQALTLRTCRERPAR